MRSKALALTSTLCSSRSDTLGGSTGSNSFCSSPSLSRLESAQSHIFSQDSCLDIGEYSFPHRVGVRLSFSASDGSNALSGALFGSQGCRKTTFENISRGPFWDPDTMDPREVPRDQNFGVKNFLISTYNELILWVLWITYAKNAKILKRRAIFYYFAL